MRGFRWSILYSRNGIKMSSILLPRKNLSLRLIKQTNFMSKLFTLKILKA
jgi:hypothetical protein